MALSTSWFVLENVVMFENREICIWRLKKSTQNVNMKNEETEFEEAISILYGMGWNWRARKQRKFKESSYTYVSTILHCGLVLAAKISSLFYRFFEPNRQMDSEEKGGKLIVGTNCRSCIGFDQHHFKLCSISLKIAHQSEDSIPPLCCLSISMLTSILSPFHGLVIAQDKRTFLQMAPNLA